MPYEVGYSPEYGLKIEYRPPEPAQAPDSLAGIVDDEEKRQHHFYAALVHLATNSCLNPDSLGSATEHIDAALTAHFRPRLGMPTKEDAARYIWLAGTMGATNLLLAHHAYAVIANEVSDGKTPPAFAPPGYYFVESFEADKPPQVALYDEGTPEDMHMRAVVKALVDAALCIRESSILPGNAYSPYLPIFRMERDLRESLPDKPMKGSAHRKVDGLSPNALDAERVRIATSQFMRNIMHGIILLIDVQPRDHTGTLRSRVRENVPAFEIAALHRRDIQRACMGIPGEPYESIRKAKNITPQVVQIGKNLRFKGLEEPPYVESMCSGAGSHYVPARFGSPIFDAEHPISAISKYVDLALQVIPSTLCRDRSN